VANPRLPRKEDVLWYLLTVGFTIIVGHRRSLSLLSHSPSLIVFSWHFLALLFFFVFFFAPRNICPHSALAPNYRGSWN
jgi:hypothetical protein